MTKREMILEIYDREAMGEVSAAEIRIIQSGLIEALGTGGMMSPAEITRVLLDEDLPVRLGEVFALPAPLDAYEELFSGRATPTTLAEAEETIAFLDRQRCRFIEADDPIGQRFARQTGQRARQNALALAATSPRGDRAPSRDDAREIAQWFLIWLETPEVFPAWLELRKRALKMAPNAT